MLAVKSIGERGLATEAPIPPCEEQNAEYAQDSITEYSKNFFQLVPHCKLNIKLFNYINFKAMKKE